ncbi:hypothetical protein ACQY0O_003847 [Thecaphora frezii]
MLPSHSASQEALRTSFHQHTSYHSTPRHSVGEASSALDYGHDDTDAAAAIAASRRLSGIRTSAYRETEENGELSFGVGDDREPFLASASLSAKIKGKGKTKLVRPGTPKNRGSSSRSIKMQRTPPHKSQKDSAEGVIDVDAAQLERGGGEARASVRRVGSRASVEGELTLDDIFDPTKTVAENKSMLISAELDRMGMGKYQICIWVLCGCGYFIDLLWAQALGLIATQVGYEFYQETGGKVGPLQAAFSTGLTVGAFFFGFAVDVVGRKWSFYLTTLTAAVFGMASGGPETFKGLCVVAAFIGFGIGGNIPIDATITLEFLPTNRRFLVAALSLFQPLGVLVCSGIAYGLIPRYACAGAAGCSKEENMGWRYTLYTLGCMTWLIFVARYFVFTFRESPQYLLARGEDEAALDVVRKIAKTNGAGKVVFGMEDFEEVERRLGGDGTATIAVGKRGKGGEKESRWNSAKRSAREMVALFANAGTLFRNRTMARVTAIVWVTFIADFWGFTLAGFYLPQILRAKGAEQDTSIATTYRNYVLIYFPGIFAVAAGAAMIEVPKVGRQWAMVLSSALMAVSFFLFTVVETQVGAVGFNAMEYFFQSLFNSILYAFVPEIYPSQVRGTASGLASTLGRIAGIVAPLAADAIYTDGTESQAKQVLYLASAVTMVCPVALAMLPYDTRGVRVF